MSQTAIPTPAVAARPQTPWYRVLYIQVLIAIAIGITLGHFWPDIGKAMKPFGDGFIALIKMMIAPVIFCTVVHGISSMGDLRRVGRVGVKTLLYFEVVSTLALAIGLIVGEIIQPGTGFNIDPATLDAKSVATYVSRAKEEGIVAHLLAIIPNSYFDALAKGDLLQVLLVSILSGFAIAALGERGHPISHAIDQAAKVFFGVIRMVVRVAPRAPQAGAARAAGALAVDMETSALYRLAGHFGARALSICTVVDNVVTQEETDYSERQCLFSDMSRLALEVAAEDAA